MNQCPIKYTADNLIFNVDKSVWAAFKIQGYDYDFLEVSSKIYMLNRVTRFLCGILSDAQLLIVPVEQDTRSQFRRMRQRLRKTDPLYNAAYSHSVGTEEYLEKLNEGASEINDYAFYIIGKLSDNSEIELLADIKDAYRFFVKNPVNAFNVFMNTDTYDILSGRIEECRRMADKFFTSQRKKLALEKVNGEELQWLLRRPAFRGLPSKENLFYKDHNYGEWHPKAEKIEIGNETVIRPFRKDIAHLFSGAIRSRGRVLEVDHDGKKSYQTFLVLTHIPDETEYPGCEWIYMLQQYNIWAEVCLHIHAVEHRESIRKLDHKKQEIDSEISNVEGAGARMPAELLEGNSYADEMEAELKAMKAPILETTVSICLASDKLEELEENVITIRNAYEDIQFVIERPFADQYRLYLNHIPSVGNMVREYMMALTPMALASGVIGAVHELGDREGPYIGTTGIERKQVFLNMSRACLLNKSASATFYGNLGFGKSFNANLLLCLNVLYGGYGLIFDPKGERAHWEKDFNLFRGMITSISLAPKPEYAGRLDPYIMYQDSVDMANELALSVITELLHIAPGSQSHTALLYAAKLMKEERKKGNKLSMSLFCDMLESFQKKDFLYEKAKELARNIRLQCEVGMGMLLFGHGEERAISFENRLNIIMIENLQLPSPETPKANYTPEEYMSTVIMMVIGQFAKKFAMTKRPVFKCILFDESWALGKTAEGVKLYDFLTRMGRSLFTGVILNGHSVLDIPTEGIKNTISYKFCFHTDNEAEAERMCEYMGMTPTQENKGKLMELKNAQCMFRDLDGHIGKLEFDAVFQDIIDVFSTTPVVETDEEIARANTEAEQQNYEDEVDVQNEAALGDAVEEGQYEDMNDEEFLNSLYEKELV